MTERRRASAAADARPDAETFACYAARLLVDDKCEQVVVLDLRRLSQVTDYFVIASCTSDRQMRSMAEELGELARRHDQAVYRQHGVDTGQWAVIDFEDVVVHLMMPEPRRYYDLESLWGDGRPVAWDRQTEAGQFADIGAASRVPSGG